MKQTAVEWLAIQLQTHWGNEDVSFEKLFEQAKAMEKVQIMQSLNDGKGMALSNTENKSPEQYYKEIFKK